MRDALCLEPPHPTQQHMIRKKPPNSWLLPGEGRNRLGCPVPQLSRAGSQQTDLGLVSLGGWVDLAQPSRQGSTEMEDTVAPLLPSAEGRSEGPGREGGSWKRQHGYAGVGPNSLSSLWGRWGSQLPRADRWSAGLGWLWPHRPTGHGYSRLGVGEQTAHCCVTPSIQGG